MENQSWLNSYLDNKYLTFLFSLDEKLNKSNDIQEIFNFIINNISNYFSNSELLKIHITYDNKNFGEEIANIDKTKMISMPIIVDNENRGVMVLSYQGLDNGEIEFSKAEKDFIKLLISRLSDYLSTIAKIETMSYKEYTPIYNAKVSDKYSKDLVNWLSAFNLTVDQIDGLLHTCLNFRKGETVCKQNAFSSYFILLAEGYCKSFVEDSKGHTLSFMVNKAFEFIALSSLYGKSFYFTTVTLTPCKIYLIEKNDFFILMEQNKDFHREVTKWLCENYNIVFEKLAIRGLKQTIGRVAHTLLYLSQTVFESDVIPNLITRKDIAEFSGMSNENCVRILSSFKRDNIIKYTKNGIQIKDFNLLKTMIIAG